MTNNNLQDQLMDFWDTHKDKLGLGEFSDELTRFVQTILTKKDQEHKAELESIKGEILSELARELYRPDELHEETEENKVTNRLNYNLFIGYQQGYKESYNQAISILDSHINKLSTE